MAFFELHTHIEAPPERVFDLARSVDFHTKSTAQTGETAVAGTTSGLLGLGDEVTWRARHFGIWQHLTVKMTEVVRPTHFSDEMLRGAFRSMRHDHTFTPTETGTVMHDRFEFRSPLGPLGVVADRLFLANYLRRLLVERNQQLKDAAESGEWRKYI